MEKDLINSQEQLISLQAQLISLLQEKIKMLEEKVILLENKPKEVIFVPQEPVYPVVQPYPWKPPMITYEDRPNTGTISTTGLTKDFNVNAIVSKLKNFGK